MRRAGSNVSAIEIIMFDDDGWMDVPRKLSRQLDGCSLFLPHCTVAGWVELRSFRARPLKVFTLKERRTYDFCIIFEFFLIFSPFDYYY